MADIHSTIEAWEVAHAGITAALSALLREACELRATNANLATKIKGLQAKLDMCRDACRFAREACVSREAGNTDNPFAWMSQRNWDQFVSHCEAAEANDE